MDLNVMLLDATGAVVAWGTVAAEPRGDGGLWALASLRALIEREATIVERVVLWPALNVAQRRAAVVVSGSPLTVGTWIDVPCDGPLLQFETPAWVLPCVTVRGNVTISPLQGHLTAR